MKVTKSEAGRGESVPQSVRSNHVFFKSLVRRIAVLLALGLSGFVGSRTARADSLIIEGDRGVLEAPESSFWSEMERLKLGQSKFKVAQAEGQASYARESLEGDLSDLRSALKAAKVPREEAEGILAEHRAEREKLCAWIDNEQHTNFPLIRIAQGLPDEFADYLEGLIAWHKSPENRAMARSAWERLMDRPPDERKYKSTWAAYMLGRSWEKDDPQKAREYFTKVRELSRSGFRDSIALAAASLGQEARICLRGKEFEPAIELYLEQQATGDDSAVASLRFAASAVVQAGPEALVQLAKNPRCQQVITTYLISFPLRAYFGNENGAGDSSEQSASTAALDWLSAVARARVHDAQSVQKFALMAYQAGDFELAQKWIELAGKAPIAQWLQAKLVLRAGDLKKAGDILAWLSRVMPVSPHGTNEPTVERFEDGLTVRGEEFSRRVSAELGVVQLARGNYLTALQALFEAGYWADAAYIAERVLTVDELKTYVDTHWPAVSEVQEDAEKAEFGNDSICPAKLREQIRHLLGRRLMRAYRSGEAREYFPSACLPSLDQWLTGITRGWDQALPAKERAEAFFDAAMLTRTHGMELLGTEVEPDWHLHGGRTEGSISEDRASSNAHIVKASTNELARARQHRTNPDERFHYRYLAASLGWAASRMMPDDSDETAHMLWTAGSWVKYLDPKTADIFYKALARRNPHTVLGAEAARRRWFPELNDEGDIIQTTASMELAKRRRADPGVIVLENETWEASPITDEPVAPDSDVKGEGDETPTQSDEEEQVEHGYRYLVQAGDTLTEIARAYTAAGVPVTVAEIREANDLGMVRLWVGQPLFIPVKMQQTVETEVIAEPALLPDSQ